jgi:uncharacterized sulfatase
LLEKYRDETDSIHVARYWAMCERFDETCGQLLDHLDECGLKENTLVVFVTDNGWIQSTDRPEYAAKSKRSQYDGGLRTPIMLRWPGKIDPATVATPVSSIDVAPTVLAACGLEPTTDMPGINLLNQPAVAQRDSVFGEVFLHNAVDIHDPASSLMYRWCVQGRWKLIVPCRQNVPDGPTELYDLDADPHETNNVADANSPLVRRLSASIDDSWPLP